MPEKLKVCLMRVACLLVVLAMPLLIVSVCTRIYAGSADLYKGGFRSNRIADISGISKADLDTVAENMAAYLSGRIASPQAEVRINGVLRPVYNAKELEHMEDVAGIIGVFRITAVLSALLLALASICIYIYGRALQLLKYVSIGSLLTICTMALVVTWSLIDFESLFYLFHILSFSNQLWLLDPSRDYLIVMFTQEFFYDSAIKLVATIIGTAIVILSVSQATKLIISRRNSQKRPGSQ